MTQFSAVEVPADAPRLDEQLGSKAKFWFERDGVKTLWKAGRENEDWSEKVAAELAGLLQLPHAAIELASLEGVRGTVSPTFMKPGEQLAHGNEVLHGLDERYDKDRRYRAHAYTVERVLAALDDLQIDASDEQLRAARLTGADQFLGYLLLDAWIANGDRHHENWGVIMKGLRVTDPPPGRQLFLPDPAFVQARDLAPTFDHAASLGRSEPEEKVRQRLTSKDTAQQPEAFAARARSAFYVSMKLQAPIDAFRAAAALRPPAATHFLTRLQAVTAAAVADVFVAVPADRISTSHREFAMRILQVNRARLLASGEAG